MHDPACDDFRRTDAQRRSLADRPSPAAGCCSSGSGRRSRVYAARARPAARRPAGRRGGGRRRAAGARARQRLRARAASTCSTRVVPVADYGRYADLRPGLEGRRAARAGRHRRRAAPLAGDGPGRRPEGPLRPRAARPPAGHRLRRPRPLALQLAPLLGGRDGHPARPPRLARALGRPPRRRATTRSRACRSRATLSPLLRGTRAPVAAVSSPADAQGWIPGVWDEWSRPLPAVATCAWPPAPPAAAGPAAVMRRRPPEPPGRPTRSSPTSRTATTGADPLAPPVAYPATGDRGGALAERLQVLAGLLAQPLGIRVATVEADGDFDTHDDQRGLADPRPRQPVGRAQRLPGRPRGARRGRPRADARVDGVRPPPAGERVVGHRPRRRRHRLRAGHAGPRRAADPVPRPAVLRPRRQPQGHRRLPRGLRRRCSRGGWAPAPTRCCPTPRASAASRWPRDRRRRRRPAIVGRRRPARVVGDDLPRVGAARARCASG